MSRILELICVDPNCQNLKAIETDAKTYIVEGRTFKDFYDLQQHLKNRTPKYMIVESDEPDKDTDG